MDLLCEGEFLGPNLLSGMNIPRKTKIKLSKIWERLPDSTKNIISENKNVMVIPFPQSVLYINNSYRILKDIQRDKIYDLFIDEKFRMPVGMHKWINMFNLSGERVENAFTFARTCTLSTISRVFQYKIATCTLPTEEYLWNYQARDNYFCKLCLNSTNNFSLERDNIRHILFACSIVAPFLSKVLNFFIKDCKAADYISEVDYLLGFRGKDYEGLNCALIELKKYIFYHFSEERSPNVNFRIYNSRLRRIVLCDKRHSFSRNKFETFYEKWKYFSPVYQIYGPDPLY